MSVVVVYKVDRLTRSLADFAKLVELFDAQGVSFISVAQAFNTTTMGRLTLSMLLSFAQFDGGTRRFASDDGKGVVLADPPSTSSRSSCYGRRRSLLIRKGTHQQIFDIAGALTPHRATKLAVFDDLPKGKCTRCRFF